MQNYLFKNGKLLIYDGEKFVIEEKDLYVKDGVLSMDASSEPAGAYTVCDMRGRLIMPGLINMHTHAYMTILRNYADDVDFMEWLFGRIDPVEQQMTPEDAYTANLLAFAEMIMSGTTAYVDMQMFKGSAPKAASEAGMRAFIGRGLVGEDLYADGYSRFSEFIEDKEEYESELIKFIMAPHAIYTCSPKLYSQAAEEAAKRGILKTTHLSESVTEVEDALKKYGKTPVAVLKETGFLDDSILAHCVQMRGDDLSILKNAGASIVTNPASNAKLGNGFAPVSEMLETGINLCLGTDGTSSNNTLNMFREMGLLSIIHKGLRHDSTAMPAQEVLKAVTVNAAKALGMEGKLGIIKEGAQADLIFIDLNTPSMYPNNNIISSLCYSANGSEVTDVMINGRFVMRSRQLTTIDLEKVLADAKTWARFLH